MKTYRCILAVLLFLSVTITACADRTFGNWHMMDYAMGGGLFMWLFLLLAIGVGVYFFVDYSKKQRSEHPETPLDVLKKRYAKGEISKEDYEQMRHDVER